MAEKTDQMGGHSRFNPFAESYRAKNKKIHAEYHKKSALQAKKK